MAQSYNFFRKDDAIMALNLTEAGEVTFFFPYSIIFFAKNTQKRVKKGKSGQNRV